MDLFDEIGTADHYIVWTHLAWVVGGRGGVLLKLICRVLFNGTV